MAPERRGQTVAGGTGWTVWTLRAKSRRAGPHRVWWFFVRLFIRPGRWHSVLAIGTRAPGARAGAGLKLAAVEPAAAATQLARSMDVTSVPGLAARTIAAMRHGRA